MSIPNLPALCKDIEARVSVYKDNLPAHVLPQINKFVSIANASIKMNLDAFEKCDKNSIFASVEKASRDGLLLDGRQAALVPYKGKATYVPMFQGLMKLARNSGDISTISAEVVFEKDEFDYQLGDTPFIRHKPTLADRGAPILAYAIAILKDGGIQRCVMTWKDIMKIKAGSASGGSSYSPWNTHPEEMAKKTVLRRLMKYLPASTDIESMFKDDDYQEPQAQHQSYDLDTGEVQEPKPTAKRTKVADKILGKDNVIDITCETVQSVPEQAQVLSEPEQVNPAEDLF